MRLSNNLRTAIAMASTTATPARHPYVAILVCDMQEAFRTRISDFNIITRTIQKVIKAANILSIPVHATEQMPSRLGPTIPELAALLPTPAIPKTTFSMLGAAELAQRLAADADADGRPWTVAVVGIEAHVCVAQTARDLRAAGHCAHVLADGVGSCNDGEVRVALSRLRAEHVAVSSSEAFLYEVMRDAAIPEFRQVLAVVREAGPDTAAAARRMMALL